VIAAGEACQSIPDSRDNKDLEQGAKLTYFLETALVTQQVCCHLATPFTGQAAHNSLAT